MLNITQVMRIRGGKMVLINKATYPNVLDAIRYYYAWKGKAENEKPKEVLINANTVYLDRLELFLKDEVDLPGFYAFVEGRGGTFEKLVAYPMCKHGLEYILGTINGENEYEHGPRCSAEIKLPVTEEVSTTIATEGLKVSED